MASELLFKRLLKQAGISVLAGLLLSSAAMAEDNATDAGEVSVDDGGPAVSVDPAPDAGDGTGGDDEGIAWSGETDGSLDDCSACFSIGDEDSGEEATDASGETDGNDVDVTSDGGPIRGTEPHHRSNDGQVEATGVEAASHDFGGNAERGPSGAGDLGAQRRLIVK